tara:strand:- start:9127 stop:9996 length:870 start_codon:yes stop_codon:yes gene_type:complete
MFPTIAPITVALFGGLGNQMFQYAFARAQSIACGAAFCLDLRPLSVGGDRHYSLAGFSLEHSRAPNFPLPPVPSRVFRKMGWSPRLNGASYVFQTTFSAPVPAYVQPAYFWGTWQGEKYFRAASSVIRGDFSLLTPFSDARQAIAQSIVSSNSVAVHVRRGDYVSNSKASAFHGTLSPQWYALAKEAMESGTSDERKYFVFSDDDKWARENINCFKDAIFIRPSSDGRDFEDLHLMALCKSQIIANSSFSWWGAWLNPNPHKRVVAPLAWFRSARETTEDLIPSSWHRV